MFSDLLSSWRHRHWRADPQALAAFTGLRPLVMITGGSEGIGFALAERFASASNDLMLVARTEATLKAAAETIRATYRVRVDTVVADVASDAAIEEIDAGLKAAGAYADVLVNCAGMGLSGRFAHLEEGPLLRLLDLNVRALSRLSLHFLKGMVARGRGGILNLASVGSYAPGPHQAAYYASKAYVLSLSEVLAFECRGMGVHVCALAPGPVRTRFHERMGAGRAVYRMLMPFSLSAPSHVAWIGYMGFTLGLRVVVPGPINLLGVAIMRLLPHRLLLPMVAFLLRPWRREKSTPTKSSSPGA